MLAHAYGPGLWFVWIVLVWGVVAFFFWRRRRWWRDPSTSGEAVSASVTPAARSQRTSTESASGS
jgi:hypothetical protein